VNIRIIWLAATGMTVALTPHSTSAQDTPAGLRGKSIVMNWTENRIQRVVGSSDEFRPRAIAQSLSVYVSTEGRLFSRRGMTNPKGDSGKREGVGQTGTSATGGLRDSRFQGDTLIVSTELGTGARLITVSFTNGFSSCTAAINVAIEAGKPTLTVKSLADGRTFEVKAVSADAVSCSMSSGNVFAQ
jgi:hypothetical protein